MSKKLKRSIVLFGIIVVLIVVTLVTFKVLKQGSEKNDLVQNTTTIKESKYTLDELYAIVENPNLFYEVNNSLKTDYNTIMFNFYDYFSKSTPVKIATETRRDEQGKVVEVLKVDYINYNDYVERMSGAYEYVKVTLEADREWNEKYGSNNNEKNESAINYRTWVEDLIYPNN